MNKYFACFTAFIFFLIASFLCFKTKPTERAFANEEKNIYLTFDDGPSDRITPKILNTLKEKNVHATFFVVGVNVTIRSELTKRIIEEGHSIGIHSYSHEYKKIYASPQALLEDIEKCSCVLKCLDIYTTLYRFPGGSSMGGKNYIRAVQDAGFRYVDWNALCGDCEYVHPTIEQLFKRAISSANDRNNIIMLLHDTTDKIEVSQALPLIIDYYKKSNYTFRTFDMT